MDMKQLSNISGPTRTVHSHRHRAGHFREGYDQAIEAKLLEIHQRCFKEGYLVSSKLQGPEYRKRAFAYLSQALQAGIAPEVAIPFHREQIYDIQKNLRENCSGGQLVGTIVSSNSTSDYLTHILSDGIGWVTDKQMRAGYAFGGTINIREAEQILRMTSDATFISYMLGHMIKDDKKNPYTVGVVEKNGMKTDALVPYMLFSCAYGSEAAAQGKSEQDIVRLALERREAFMADWGEELGFIVCNDKDNPYISLYDKRTGDHPKIYIPVVLHDLKECKFYVMEDGGKKKTEFSEWTARFKLDQIDIVDAHLQAMKGHREERGYFDELTKLSAKIKESYCVDSRHMTDLGAMLKDLGAILNEDIMWKVLTNPITQKFSVCLHFNCGYLTTAMKIHEMGMEIRRRLDNLKKMITGGAEVGGLTVKDVEAAEVQFKSRMTEMLRKKKQKEKSERRKELSLDYNKFKDMLEKAENGKELPKDLGHIFEDLFEKSLSDTRNTVKHMAGRDILNWDNELNTVVMIAARQVDRLVGPECPLLQQNREGKAEAATLQANYYALVTLSAANDEEKYWRDFKITHNDGLIEGRKITAANYNLKDVGNLEELPSTTVRIENMDTGVIITVNKWPELTDEFRTQLKPMGPLERLSTVLSKLEIWDAVTKQKIDDI